MKKSLLIALLFLLVSSAQARIVLDAPQKKTPPKEIPKLLIETKKTPTGYLDVPPDHWAREAIGELVEVGVLEPGIGRKFWGDDPVDKFRLMYFLAQIMEKLLLGETGELELADASLGYKDVTPINPAYRSIQKLIALGVLPPGFRQEVFNGDVLVSRYQLAYFLFTPLEKLLSPNVAFEEADPADGYTDVPRDNFAYPAIQKLIKLDVLPGKERFEGNTPATRYWMAYLSVKILKQVYLKIKEEEFVAPPPLPEYGFRTFLSTNLYANFQYAGKGASDLLDLAGTQNVNLSVDRTLSQNVSAYLSLENQFSFGSTAASRVLSVGEAFLTLKEPRYSLQSGRATNYFSYNPFGASLFLDNRTDAVNLAYYTDLANISGAIGKLWYQSDVTADSNFASLLLSSNPLSFLEFSLGGNYITDPLDPTATTQLPTKIQQYYGGAKLNFSNFEIALESSNSNFSNPDVLPVIGTTDEVDTAAYQAAISYYSPEYGYNLSIGYQHLGDDFYNAGLADPSLATNSRPGRDAVLLKSRTLFEGGSYVDVNFGALYQKGRLAEEVAGLLYCQRLFQLAYLNLNLTGTFDPSDFSRLNALRASGSVSVSF